MEHLPTQPDRGAEPEILPPDRGETPRRDGTSQVWISFSRQGYGRTYTLAPGAPAIFLALLFGALMVAIFVVVFATLLLWLVIAGAVIALLVAAALLLRRFRRYWR